MIIFTEHNEVIMSENDMRKLIRAAFRAGALNAKESPSIPISLMENREVSVLEDLCRNNKNYLEKLED